MTRRHKKWLPSIFLLLLACSSNNNAAPACPLPPAPHPTAKNIILMIGDGMGSNQRLAAQYSSVGQDGLLVMDQLPHHGSTRTASANSTVTDSAAAATAMASGVKTLNGTIGMDLNLLPRVTILEQAQQLGKATGLVTTVQISHATPAAFAAHVPSRSQTNEIAQQLSEAEIDVLLGGGEDAFLPLSTHGCYPEPGERQDGRNLIVEMASRGYTYVCNSAALASLDTSVPTRVLGLFADEGLPRPNSPSLAEMTERALEFLALDSDGFFLMVEGGQIDWAGHANDGQNVINDTLDFNAAVETALSFQTSNPDTLVIVTADHETGGMLLSTTATGASNEDGPFLMPDGTPFFINWSTTGHTRVKIATTAVGPLAEAFGETLENTCIYDVMARAFGIN